MEADETNNAGIVAAAVMEKRFIVVCADMAFYNSREAIHRSYELVFTVAEDEEAACYQAQKAVLDGGIPLAAFDEADLLKSWMKCPPASWGRESRTTGRRI